MFRSTRSTTSHDGELASGVIDLVALESEARNAGSTDSLIDLNGDGGSSRAHTHGVVDRRPARPQWSWIDSVLVLVTVGIVVWLATTQPRAGLLFTVAAGVLAGGFVARRNMTRYEKRAAVLGAMVAAGICDYLAWRVRIINWHAPWLSVPLFAAEVFAALHILGFHFTLWPREAVPLADDDVDPTTRPLFILIPTVDEGVDILRETVQGALAARARYVAQLPHARVEVVVCNDGGVLGAACSSDVEQMCRDLGVRCVTRVVGGGAKAGNIEHARQVVGATGDALVVIFDADQVARPDFLLATVPSFRDASIAWVQTGQYYRNLENPVARWANDQQAIFYRMLCAGKSASNGAYICGTNVVVRAAALDEIGGFPQTSVTEDFAASIVLHQRWRSIFVPGQLAHGLGPVELNSYFRQQRRWARGSAGVLRSHWRDIFLPRRRGGLHPEQRAQYWLAGTHYMCGLRDFVYVSVPIVFLVTGVSAVQGATLGEFLAHFVPCFVLTQVAYWHAAEGKSTLRGVVIGFGSFPVLSAAFLRGLFRGDGTFSVTPKQRVGNSALRHVAFHVVCLFACVGAIVTALVRGGGAPVVISSVWAVYTGVFLAGFISLAVADHAFARGRALTWRPRVAFPRMTLPRMTWRAAASFGVVALALVAAFGLLEPAGSETKATAAGIASRGIGVDFTTDLLVAEGTTLPSQLGGSVGLVGRTQEISDHFDRAWAERVTAARGRPWVTLLFSAPRRPRFEASLLSVANGVHDGDLRRWARAIREFGKPVDLTVLPDVDRDWALTSAVANGGIPQDSARAWGHVRAVFRAEGATNAAWVWAPADPSADRAYAPAAGTYDAVLLTLIEFPATKWPDPHRALARAHAQHPDVPLFVETSVAGPERQRIEWLRRLGSAIDRASYVTALIYHEGGPAPVATPAERAAWSLSASPRLAAAFAGAADRLERGRFAVATTRALARAGGTGGGR